jgi:uroporphyrinogen-III decarboxylase
MLSSRELVSRAVRGMPTSRPVCGPLAVHYCARLAGVSLRDYTLDPSVLADCVQRYYETFRPDAVWLSADTWVNAQAMGAAVGFPSGDQPMAGVGGPCVRSVADIDRIPRPDPTTQGRWPLMLEALRRVRN